MSARRNAVPVMLAGVLWAPWTYAGVVVAVRPVTISSGGDHEAVVMVTGPDVPIRSVGLSVTVGTIHDVTRVAPGVYTAHYVPPVERTPDVALVTASIGDEVGCASFAIVGRYHLRVRVEPLARVSVTVASDRIERVASTHGRVEIFLDVSPGTTTAEVTAEDRVGNRTVTLESMNPPPAHRLAVLDAGEIDPRHRRVWVLAASSTGQLDVVPPRVTVDHGDVSLDALAPGVFLAAVLLPRGQSGMSTVVRAESPGAVPAEIALVSPPAVVTALGVLAPSRVIAGERVTVRVNARDVDGVDVTGMASALSLHASSGTIGVAVPLADGAYGIPWIAPLHPTEAILEITSDSLSLPSVSSTGSTAHGGMPTMQATARVAVVAGVPARWAVRDTALQVGNPGVVTLVPMDRFGNLVDTTVPWVEVSGGTWRSQRWTPSGLRVTLVPARADVLVVLHESDGRVHRVGLHAAAPELPFEAAVVVRAENNLHGLWAGGLRLRTHWVSAHGPWRVLVGIGTGYDGGHMSDAQGRSATVQALPLEARVGGAFVSDRWRLGAWGWAGGWWVYRSAMGTDASTASATSITPGVGTALGASLRFGETSLGVEFGYDAVRLDSGPVTGNLAGAYAALTWTYGAW